MTTSSLTEQQRNILQAAAEAISESSLLDFKMAAIAKAAGTSMGTVYKHVQSKEDVLVGLATESYLHLHRVYKDVLDFPVNLPERLISLFLVSPEKTHLYDFGAHLEMMILNPTILVRASAGWRERMVRADTQISDLFVNAMIDGCEQGELLISTEQRGTVGREMLQGLWALSFGFMGITFQQLSRELGGSIPQPPSLTLEDPIIHSAKRLLSTYPWRTPPSDGELAKACRLLEEKGYR